MRARLALLFASCAHAAEIPPYNETDAFLHLRYAMATFCDRGAIEEWTCGTACAEAPVVKDSVQVFGPGAWSGVLGYVAKLPGPDDHVQCVVAFRGSVNAANWRADATMNLVSWPTSNSTLWTPNGVSWCRDCQVHEGFATAYDELSDQMLREMHALGCTSTKVVGHSLGAAVATVAAMDLRGRGTQVDMLWTFGSPRVGDDAFVTSYVALADRQHVSPPSWRVVHFHDPVPTGPPSDYFTHIPVLVYYNTREYTGEASGYTICPWFHQNMTDEGTCGNVQSSTGWTVVNQADGLIQVDHTNYLGIPVGMKDLEDQCVATNRCLHDAGFRTTNYTRGVGFLDLIFGFLLGGVLGAWLMYLNHKFNKVPVFVADRPVDCATDGVTQAWEMPINDDAYKSMPN